MSRRIIFLIMIAALVYVCADSQNRKLRVGVLDFVGNNVSRADANIATDFFMTELVASDVYDVLDRGNRDEILKEQAFQQTGCTESACAVKIGKMLNMQYMFFSSLSRMGETYTLSAGMVDIETGKVIKALKEKLKRIDDTDEAAKRIVASFSGVKQFNNRIALTAGNRVEEETKVVSVQRDVQAKNMLGIELVKISGGSYNMGGKGQYDGKPAHHVTISSFYMAKTEITYHQWKSIFTWAIRNGYEFENMGNDLLYAMNKDINCPVNNINWHDAVKWCNAYSEMEGRSICYFTGSVVYRKGKVMDITCKWDVDGYRLPTEAEWEMAYRAETVSAYYWGEDMDDIYAWWSENSGGKSHPVGLKKPNKWGLYDMSGNVWEWCWDVYQEKYSTVDNDNPKGAEIGNSRVVRGGSFAYIYDGNWRAAYRAHYVPGVKSYFLGFRIAVSAK